MSDIDRSGETPDDADAFGDIDPGLSDRLAELDDDLAEQRAASLRAGLGDYELDDEDLELLEGSEAGPDGITYLPALPVLAIVRSEEHTSELQSRENLVCRLLLEKKKQTN